MDHYRAFHGGCDQGRPMILLWRSITQLAGGAGLAVIMMSAIVGPTGAGISIAEGRGDQLVPQVRQSARLVLIIYAGYAVVGTLSYRAVECLFSTPSTIPLPPYPQEDSQPMWKTLATGIPRRRGRVDSADADRQYELRHRMVLVARPISVRYPQRRGSRNDRADPPVRDGRAYLHLSVDIPRT